MHAAGVHPTVAGVALGLLTRVRARRGRTTSPVERLRALLAADVRRCRRAAVRALQRRHRALRGRALGGRLATRPPSASSSPGCVGKTVGVFGGAYLRGAADRGPAQPRPRLGRRVRRRHCSPASGSPCRCWSATWRSAPAPTRDDAGHGRHPRRGARRGCSWAPPCCGSRHRHYERLYVEENRDDDHDGIPDVYQQPTRGQTAPDGPASPTTEGSSTMTSHTAPARRHRARRSARCSPPRAATCRHWSAARSSWPRPRSGPTSRTAPPAGRCSVPPASSSLLAVVLLLDRGGVRPGRSRPAPRAGRS